VIMIKTVNNDAPLDMTSDSSDGNVSINLRTTNGVGVMFTGFRVDYFYNDMTPVTEARISRAGALTKYMEGYEEATVSINVVSSEVRDFVLRNPDTDDDDIASLVARISVIGTDENENQISTTGNVEIYF
ncbi:MAG: hypothetical protein ACOCWO_06110, partial [Candidatus Muiribacteriaceae bacterium]